MDDDLYDDIMPELDDLLEEARITKKAKNIADYYLWFLCALGIPGNIFTIISILTMKKMSTGTMFVVMLATCDWCALVSKLIEHLLAKNGVYFGDNGCKFLIFIPVLFSVLANWALVLITLERFFAVCFPLKKVYLFTKRRSYILAGILSIVLLTIHLVVYSVMYEANDSGYRCGTKHTLFFKKAFPWINTTLLLFLPFLIIATLTVLIVVGLHSSRRERRSMLQNDGARSCNGNNRKLLKETERAEKMITIMLILAATLFVILALPAGVYQLAKPDLDTVNGVTKAKWEYFHQITFVMLDSTHAINFFLYFVSAKRFRNHFISLITCKHFNPRSSKTTTSDVSHATESSKVFTEI